MAEVSLLVADVGGGAQVIRSFGTLRQSFRLARGGRVAELSLDAGQSGRRILNAPTSVASSTRALTVGSKVKLRVNASRYTASERRMIEAAIDETNLRIAGGAETSVVGEQVPFSSYQSRRYIRDRFFPDKPVSQVKVSDADELMGFTVNVDEIVPRQIGGRQVFENQRVLSERLNKALGPIEERALRSQPEGMRVQGFYIEWY